MYLHIQDFEVHVLIYVTVLFLYLHMYTCSTIYYLVHSRVFLVVLNTFFD
jgi:hypothetical protein